MPTTKKSTSKSKSRVSTQAKKTGFKFHWWMAAVLVLVIGGIGLAVLRYSQASARALTGTVISFNLPQGGATVNINGYGPINFVRYPGNTLNGSTPGWSSDYLGWCASMQKGFKSDAFTNIRQGDKVFVVVYDGKNAQSCYGDASVN